MSGLGARRAIVLVIDACGVGALPDADRYGDAGTNTLVHLAEAVGGLRLPTLAALGLGGAPRGGRARDPRPPARARTGQGLRDRTLGADGGGSEAAAAHLPGGF